MGPSREFLGRTLPFQAAVIPLVLLLFPWRAIAAEGGASAPSESIFLVQVLLLLIFGRLFGEGMQRLGQPAVMGQLIAGIVLGPSLFGLLWPELQHQAFPPHGEQKSMIDAMSQFGILMLLLLTGMETDLNVVRKSRRAAVSVSLSGILVPFACGFALGQLLPDSLLPDPGRRFITSLFLGTALSISSVKIVAMVVREVGFMRRTVGQVMIASAIIDDTIGWIIMALTFGLAAHGRIDLASVGQTVAGTAIFLTASFMLGPRLVFLMIRWANDNLVMEVPVITTILVLMGTMALITQAIGVHTVLGAFVAGILVGQSPILTKHIDEQMRGLIVALFMPVFFGLAGQHTDLGVLRNTSMLWLSLGMILIASLGKFGGAFLGGKLGGMTPRESLALAAGMNARGSTEVIVATLGLTMGVLNEGLFTTIIVMAIVTTMAMPPMLRWTLSRIPLHADEKERLDREEMEARGFVTNFERLLLTVDQSPSGRLASRLTGLLSRTRRLVTTVLPIAEDGATSPSAREDAPARASPGTDAEERIKAVGERKIPRGEEAGQTSASLDIETARHDRPVEEAVPEQARKGYDFLLAGVEPAVDDGRFTERVTRVANGFQGPFGLVFARGQHREDPDRAEKGILVPVTGTAYSRHGAEFALALAQASGAFVTVLYVASRSRGPAARRRLDLEWERDGNQEAILRDIVRLGEQMGVTVHPVLRRRGTPDEAILRQMRNRSHELIVMGVSRRPGETLFFGDVADVILEQSLQSLILVSS